MLLTACGGGSSDDGNKVLTHRQLYAAYDIAVESIGLTQLVSVLGAEPNRSAPSFRLNFLMVIFHIGLEEMGVTALADWTSEIIGQKIYWIGLIQFVVLGIGFRLLPEIGRGVFGLLLSSLVTMIFFALVIVLPLAFTGSLPLPRDAGSREAYFYGFLSGVVLSNALLFGFSKLLRSKFCS